jgi:arsenite-transporting ATPase
VLVASTDPAHSLGDALDAALGEEPVAVDVGEGRRLLAVEIAGVAAYRRWLGERREALVAIAERGSLLVREQAERLLGLPMPGADELVGLLEVVRLAAAAGCEEVVVDTAPTGHTLRLIESPEVLRRLADLLAAVDERHRVLAATFGGGAGEAEPALARLEEEARFLGELLRDRERSRFVWVTTAEELAVEEARDGFAALARQGVPVAEVVVDRWPSVAGGAARRAAEAAALAELAALAPEVPFRHVPELEAEPRGPQGLAPVAAALAAPARSGEELAAAAREGAEAAEVRPREQQQDAEPPPDWLDELVPPGLSLLLVGGKGGVGKTTCAATIASWAAAARPGRAVRLVSVDPAHSLGDVLAQPLGDEPRAVTGAAGDLVAREVDAPAAWGRLRERLAGDLDRLLGWGDERSGGAATIDREVLRRLLESTPPGIDELVALVEIAEAAGAVGEVAPAAGAAPTSASGPIAESDAGELARAGDSPAAPLVIVDTAPTGHTLRLLEMPELALSWVQALMAILLDLREAFGLGALAEELVALSRRLRAFQALRGDPGRCRFLLVTRAGELPRRESERLAAALERMGVALAATVQAAAPPRGPSRVDAGAAAAGADAAAGAGASVAPPAAATPAAGVSCVAGRAAAASTGVPGPPLRLLAPAVYPPPRGVAALRAWGRTWRRGP